MKKIEKCQDGPLAPRAAQVRWKKAHTQPLWPEKRTESTNGSGGGQEKGYRLSFACDKKLLLCNLLNGLWEHKKVTWQSRESPSTQRLDRTVESLWQTRPSRRFKWRKTERTSTTRKMLKRRVKEKEKNKNHECWDCAVNFNAFSFHFYLRLCVFKFRRSRQQGEKEN